jgi:hypothetical protein
LKGEEFAPRVLIVFSSFNVSAGITEAQIKDNIEE